ncbi:endonuclease/exonuclease/phosphatase family protein [Rhodobacter calidifons]|uniref:Endonuclease/exonuclease/phosphatase family protein n=1 Tax=Rhodobacter calidifons TaxID=2715277 RepID=A0ABX0G7F8_9RHOB|nr:endonuclease/exonuclease/phosphatase family protein [Rhodobacter calidifons]NHB77141.1 endonuclease/exonuclease/phosphatase family protein [Rhodobacter calidifons]
MKLRALDIATFNLLNLNESGLPLYRDDDGWSQAAYDLKIDWTARVMTRLKPHVMGFQELWHRASLERAVAAAGLAAEYDLLIPPDADGTRILCAAMVAKGLLVGRPEWISDFPEAFVLESRGDDPQTAAISVKLRGFSRPVLHFTIRPRDDQPLVHVFVCHFKSKDPTRVFRERWFNADREGYKPHQTNLGSALSTIRRTAEASALRFLLTGLMRGTDAPVIVLGDINDGQMSNTANILTEQPRYLVGDSIGGGDLALYTAQTLQEYRNTRDVYYTHIHQDMMESLDHILVSQEFYDNSRKRIWLFAGMVVMNDHLNWDDHKDSGTNDHGIVSARFRYRPMKAEARALMAGPAG